MAFVTWAEYTVTRIIVLISAIIIAVFAILSLISAASIISIIISAIVLVVALLGALGAVLKEVGWLQLYHLLLIVMALWIIIYVIIEAATGNISVGDLVYDIVLAAILGILAMLVGFLIRHTWYRSSTLVI